MTWDLREGGESRPLRFLFLMRLLRGFIIAHPTVHVVYEAPMGMAVMGRLGTGEATVALLRGTVAILEATCAEYGRPVEGLRVQDAREAVLGWRTHKRGKGKGAEKTKARVMRELGQFHSIVPDTIDEADACVLWLYAAARTNPRIALELTPLFRA